MADLAVANPFTTEQARELKQAQASTDVAVQRELAEVQAAVLMARRFPRDPVQAMDAILRACTRTTLAQGALYEYARGGTDITGPSIRLAEAMAQTWGNLAFGIRELEQRAGESTMESYCWDMETNVRQSRVFQVRHERHTRAGAHRLSDPRDIYETVANQGARRLRACILGVIPGDVVEAAVAQCEQTLQAEADTSTEGIKKLLDAFSQFGVTQQMIEVHIQRRAESIRPAQVVQLRKIWSSLNDGMSEISDWFETTTPETTAAPATGNEALRQRLRPSAEPPGRVPPDPAVSAEPPGEDRPSPGDAPAPRRERPPRQRAPRPPPTEDAVPALAAEAPEPITAIVEIKPVRREDDRGWDWVDYANRYIAAGRALPVSELGRFRARNASLFEALHIGNKEEWSRCGQMLAEYEREGK